MNNQLKTEIDTNSDRFRNNSLKFSELIDEYKTIEEGIKLGGGALRIQKQHDKGRMTARERINHLIDDNS